VLRLLRRTAWAGPESRAGGGSGGRCQRYRGGV